MQSVWHVEDALEYVSQGNARPCNGRRQPPARPHIAPAVAVAASNSATMMIGLASPSNAPLSTYTSTNPAKIPAARCVGHLGWKRFKRLTPLLTAQHFALQS